MTSEARIASLGHMQGESSAPKMSIGVLGWTDQTTNYTIMSLGAIHGRMWRGKRFQCCGQSGGREKKWLWIIPFSREMTFQTFPNLLPTPNLTGSHLPNSYLLPLSAPLQFYLYFLEAWHHLPVLSLVFHQLIHTRTMPLRAGNENEDPRKCQAGILPFGATSQLVFFAAADTTMYFLIQLQTSISPHQ